MGYRPTENLVKRALKEYGPGGFDETLEKANEIDDISRPAFNDALKDLREKGDVEKFYDEGRDKLLYRLTNQGKNSIRDAIIRLNQIEKEEKLDIDKGENILSVEVVKFLLRLQTLKWQEEKWIKLLPEENFKKIAGVGIEDTKKSWIISDKQVDKPIEELDFTEYDLLNGLAQYYFETRFVKYHNKNEVELYRTFDERAFKEYRRNKKEKRKAKKIGKQGPRLLLESILWEGEENSQNRDFIFLEETLKDFYEKEKNNPIFFPVKYVCEERGFTKELEQLLKWIEPLLSPSFPDEPKTDKETIEKLEKLGIPWGPPEPRLGSGDNLAGIVFLREAQTHADDRLRPAWLDCFSEKTNEV